MAIETGKPYLHKVQKQVVTPIYSYPRERGYVMCSFVYNEYSTMFQVWIDNLAVVDFDFNKEA